MTPSEITLIFHIIAGSIALTTMALSYLVKKGPKLHAKIGRIYVYSMIGVGITAVTLFIFGSPTFFLLIAFFSLYLVLVGWRFAVNRKGLITKTDTILIRFGIIAGLLLLIFAIYIAFSGQAPFGLSNSFAIVPVVFAFLSIGLAYQQKKSQQTGSNPKGKKRITLHLTYMGAGTISTITAFTITIFDHSIFTWLGATILITPILTWYNIRVNKGTVAKNIISNTN